MPASHEAFGYLKEDKAANKRRRLLGKLNLAALSRNQPESVDICRTAPRWRLRGQVLYFELAKAFPKASPPLKPACYHDRRGNRRLMLSVARRIVFFTCSVTAESVRPSACTSGNASFLFFFFCCNAASRFLIQRHLPVKRAEAYTSQIHHS